MSVAPECVLTVLCNVFFAVFAAPSGFCSFVRAGFVLSDLAIVFEFAVLLAAGLEAGLGGFAAVAVLFPALNDAVHPAKDIANAEIAANKIILFFIILYFC
jgi:hypothetical protein